MTNDIIKNCLFELGFNSYDSELYLYLLKNPKYSITKLAKLLTVQRLTIYRSLAKLSDFGLIEEQNSLGKSLFRVGSPNILLGKIYDKKVKITRISNDLEKAIPELLDKYYENKKDSRVKIFEEKEGFFSVLKDILDCSEDEFYAFGSSEILNYFPEYSSFFTSQRIRKNIIAKNISFWESNLSRHDHNVELRVNKFLPKNYQAGGSFVIYGNKIAIWNTVLPKIIVIEDKIIYETFKVFWQLLWDGLDA